MVFKAIVIKRNLQSQYDVRVANIACEADMKWHKALNHFEYANWDYKRTKPTTKFRMQKTTTLINSKT